MDYLYDLLSVARLARHKKLLGIVDLTMCQVLFSCGYTEEQIITGLEDQFDSDNFELWLALSMRIILDRHDLLGLMLEKLDKILKPNRPDIFEHPYFFSTRILSQHTGAISYLKSHPIIASRMQKQQIPLDSPVIHN